MLGNKTSNQTGRVAVIFAVGLLTTGLAAAQDSLPDMTDDGLERVDTRAVQALYWLPGASLGEYRRIMILDCFVAFRKDWERDQNRSRPGIQRVTADDMDRIKQALADEFLQTFTNELQSNDGYEIVDTPAEDVLLLRPAIVNLDVAAPDLPTADISQSYTASAGSMTLYLELYDSSTSSLIGRAMDARAAQDNGSFQVANSVTNRAEAERILSRWAKLLRDALDEQWGGPQ